MKTVIDILEQNKIQVQSTNCTSKRLFSVQLQMIQPQQSTTHIVPKENNLPQKERK